MRLLLKPLPKPAPDNRIAGHREIQREIRIREQKIDADDADKGGEQAEAVSVRKTRYQKDRQNVGQRDVGSRVFERMKKAERDGRGGTHEKQGKSPALYVCRKRTEFFDDRAGLEPIF